MIPRTLRIGLAATAAAGLALAGAQAGSASAAVRGKAAALTQVSSDPYSDSQAQHATEVEPDIFSYGGTTVSAFQVGRVSSGGASNIGWSTSTDGGTAWTHGYLPDTTANTGGKYTTVSDATVAYDADHGEWIVSYLGILSNGNVDVDVSRSANGTTWGNPVPVATGTFYDKNWTVCDNHAASPYYGHCYTEFDTAANGDTEDMSTSTNGGASWSSVAHPADSPSGIGGQPLVQPNGTVVVPFASASANQIRSFVSTNGGGSWGSSVLVATTHHHTVAGLADSDAIKSSVAIPAALRESVLPSAEIDAAGKVYVSWADCKFRTNCASNDIIISTSTNGTKWTTPVRVPIDAVSSTDDHFTPGLGVDASTSGSTARIGLTYYYYPVAKCNSSTCQLDVGYISSTNGGSTWSAPAQLAGPMKTTWLPNTDSGRMFGDYIATTIPAGGNAVSVFPVAAAPSGTTFAMAMYAPTGGLPIAGGAR
ncbi:MAG TPA: sialidase family protein [Actinospica sp.]|nr:sialidase family protein [Actinospica sp.]